MLTENDVVDAALNYGFDSENEMKQISAGKFKTHCLAVVNEVQATGEPVVITKHGKPVVKIVPAEMKDDSIFGYMAGKAKIVGDIISPASLIEDWEATDN
jgi:prevent-host-death family protein